MPKINDGGISREMTPEELKTYEETQSTIKNHEQEQAKVQYKDDRKIAYPEIGDQLDDLFKQGVFSKEMTAKLQQVKTDNPKPE
tara:strand:- start:268 stop:519 length:252 start_codon:yes stop_codon:yes gene_type:complete